MSRILFLFAIVASLSPGVASAAVTLFSEGGPPGNDLSNNNLAPTPLGELPIGESVVTGTIFNIDGNADADVFTFSVGVGQALDVMMLDIEGGQNEKHFFGLDEGPQAIELASELLIARRIDSSAAGDNLLTDPIPPIDDFGGSGVSGPLGPGDYTVWIQENDFDNLWFYTLTLQTSVTAIPEPSSALVLGFATVVCCLKRRRRR